MAWMRTGASLCTEGEGGPPGNVTRAKVDADYASSLVYFTSSSRHPSPHLDGIVFMISSITTVGWGSQPVDFLDAPEGKESVFLLMKLFLVVTLIAGLTWLGLLIGSMGQAFRAFFRAHHMLIYETVISNTPLVCVGDRVNIQGCKLMNHSSDSRSMSLPAANHTRSLLASWSHSGLNRRSKPFLR